ncbi:MAG TPA: long-chain-fatty-acid--CoA ligase [Ktedonobacterales bacterium]|nr:long-chain-fatty-acid--CoA ligase [Ktedonobacterales bacterium]
MSQIASGLFRPALDIPDVRYDTLLRRSAERAPNRTAIIAGNITLTYREVVALVDSLANGLRQLGVGKGDHIGVFTANRPEYPIILNAAATIGAVFSPINPAYKEREVAYQLADAEAKILFVQRALLPLAHSVIQAGSFPHLRHLVVLGESENDDAPSTLTFASLLRAGPAMLSTAPAIGGDDVLVLPYSSGTTGLPKGVMLTHRNLVANHIQFPTAAHFTENDITLIFLPMYHIYGVLLTGSFLAAGATQVIMERFNMEEALNLCEQYSATWFFAVPPILLGLNAQPDEIVKSKLRTVKYVMNAAAPLAPALGQAIAAKLGVQVVQGYGLTESSPDTHFSPLNPALDRPGSVGLVVHNTEQKVVDQETGERDLGPGEVGEIVVRGPQVMLGYWKAPEETARTLRNGWLHTGDIGYIDADGFLYIVDRKKEMIKYKGFGIAPAELESLLLEHPAVLDSAVIGVPDPEAGELPKGFVVIRQGHDVTPEDILTFANGKLAGYKKLHEIEFIDVIPKVASGKILRRELKEREKARRAGNAGQQ